MQKFYRGYRSQRRLADSSVVTEELWWQAIEYARLNHSTTSFFKFLQPEKAVSPWNRVSWNASKVGKGLGMDDTARKLAFQHWIEAIDPRHRYGHNLNIYFDEWCRRDANQPFFYWLDVGTGKEVDLDGCPRSRLLQECIKYLGPQEREYYEYVVVGGEMIHKRTGDLLDTKSKVTESKWIFVMSTSNRLYAGEKRKGMFHHSSFLAGGVTLAAGRLAAECGKLKSVSAYSGHYQPTDNNLSTFTTFLQSNGVNLEEVQIVGAERSDKGCNAGSLTESEDERPKITPAKIDPKQSQNRISAVQEERQCSVKISPSTDKQRKSIPSLQTLQRFESTINTTFKELGHHVSF